MLSCPILASNLDKASKSFPGLNEWCQGPQEYHNWNLSWNSNGTPPPRTWPSLVLPTDLVPDERFFSSPLAPDWISCTDPGAGMAWGLCPDLLMKTGLANPPSDIYILQASSMTLCHEPELYSELYTSSDPSLASHAFCSRKLP